MMRKRRDVLFRRFAARWSGVFWVAAGFLLLSPLPMLAQTAETIDTTSLRVCADPNNLPFSNEKGEGFENKIAELLAKDLGVPVRYTWYPDSPGLVRATLNARRCDVIMGTASGNTLVQNTNPYYRSTYALIYGTDRGLTVKTLEDPVLKTLKIGAIAGTPPTTILATQGLLSNLRSYQLVVDTRFEHPAEELIHDVAAGTIDVGVVWGPIAGFYAQRESTPLSVVALESTNTPMQMDYRITMGVRHNEPEWKRKINGLIRKHQAEINKILFEFGVPLLDEQGKPLAP
jgi:quinoprotein dehydrogenase-associated probable ABC transporter substrate-binding protein